MISWSLSGVVKVLGSVVVFMAVYSKGDYENGGRVVYLNSRLLEWSQAAQECQDRNGTLVTLVDISTMYDVGLDGRWIVWAGLKVGDDPTNMTWSTGLSVSWTNWIYPPQPHESGGQCLAVETSPPFDWKAVNCSTKLPSLCEVQTENPCHFSVSKRSSLIGFLNSYITDIDLISCQQACINETAFKCRSFEYNSKRRICQLSENNRWMQKRHFTTFDPEWDYYHLDCYTSEVNQTITLPTLSPLLPTTVPSWEATTEKVCIPLEDLLPHENATKQIEMVIQELQDLQTRYKNKRRSMKKESTMDPRPSAATMGGLAIAIVSAVIGIIIILDMLTLARHTCHKAEKRKRKKLSQLANESLKQVGQSIMAKRNLTISVHHIVIGNGKPTSVNDGPTLEGKEDSESVNLAVAELVDGQPTSKNLEINCTDSNNEAFSLESEDNECPPFEEDVKDNNIIQSQLNTNIHKDFMEPGHSERGIFKDVSPWTIGTDKWLPRPHRSYSEPNGRVVRISTLGGTRRSNNYPNTWHHATMAGSSYAMQPFMSGWRLRDQRRVDFTQGNHVMETSFRCAEDNG